VIQVSNEGGSVPTTTKREEFDRVGVVGRPTESLVVEGGDRGADSPRCKHHDIQVQVQAGFAS